MTYQPPAYVPEPLAGPALTEALVRYATNPIYLDNEEWENDDNPYRRQLRPQVLPYLSFDQPLNRAQLLQYESLAANRMLTSIYEADLMFLPKGEFTQQKHADFTAFYSAANRTRGEAVRPALERFAFGFLDDEVTVSGEWTTESLTALLGSLNERERDVPLAAENAILASTDRERAAKMWLIQFIPDFLSEASPMIRNVLGYFGAAQSEWFKIVIDEYGYGVHAKKHSTLYEHTLESVGLHTDLHHYWQYYLPSSLMMNNYFHYLGKNHELFYRYLGALYYTETTLVDFCRRSVSLLREVFGDTVDVEYFSEHVHIDTHHGRMALDNLILPIVEQCGPSVIPEIVRGYEEYQLLASIADRDFCAQIEWMDEGPLNKQLHDPVWEGVQKGLVDAPVAHLDEPFAELSNTHSHQGDELCHIVSGVMRFVSGFESYSILEAGEGTVIRRNRLHGAIIESERCEYEIHSIEDYRKCLS